MNYIQWYDSPIGRILLAADDVGLVGVWFEGQRYFAENLESEHCKMQTAALRQTSKWLDIYFDGAEPDFMPPLHVCGTPFQMKVWELLTQIPYGATVTYGQLAERIAANRGIKRMSARAVGGAVGRNNISIIIPCHRVVGANGKMTGYAGGIDKKIALLDLEKRRRHFAT